MGDPPYGSTRIHYMDPPESITWIHQDPLHGSTRIHYMDPPGSANLIYQDPTIGSTRIHNVDLQGFTRIHHGKPGHLVPKVSILTIDQKNIRFCHPAGKTKLLKLDS